MTQVNHRCAVLGKPIAHSLSPVLHNAAYRALGLDDWRYDRHEVGEEDLDGFLKGLDPTWAGLSLTMPLKKTIQPYGEPSNLWARELKVANTAVFDWSGNDGSGEPKPQVRLYNTDVVGIQLAFDHATRAAGIHTDDDRQGLALVIGNGNTASSAVAACTMMPEIGHITVAARHPDKNPALKPLAEKFLRRSNALNVIALDDDAALLDAFSKASVVVSTIPGRAADPVASLLAEASAAAKPTDGARLLDVVYDPRPTALMHAWRERGGLAIGGEEMLLYQALIQVLLMTGIWDGDPPSDADSRLQNTTVDDDHVEIAMRQALEEVL
ncbi:shikimate dehydrogenase family protein [Bifidobacterium avesanii]|uniref:Shikimate dehydrogenase n=1 Tax=Bifidobacterium avesanii TaxID=1798157 RepID=A0A7K3TE68_9BIFI|nr:shikimate dehydrogenase [Bifidobacterium avesanii]KAB8295399.1 shikimate 5-dehydrogenase I alpha [Bifidobacterium avesanii]NEG77405.1 shikimate dehydrogenase [Bifidobacterium avesanii]